MKYMSYHNLFKNEIRYSVKQQLLKFYNCQYAIISDKKKYIMLNNMLKYKIIFNFQNDIFIKSHNILGEVGIRKNNVDYYIIVLFDLNRFNYNYYLLSIDDLKQLIVDNKYFDIYNGIFKKGYLFSKFVIKENSIIL